MRAGVNILGALEIVAKTAGNVVIEDAVMKTKTSIQGGESITKPLVDSGVFPPMVTRMISIGEKTGALEKLLMKIAEFYDQEVRATVKALTSLIEPLMISAMGLIVGFIVLAIFLPILQMQRRVTKYRASSHLQFPQRASAGAEGVGLDSQPAQDRDVEITEGIVARLI